MKSTLTLLLLVLALAFAGGAANAEGGDEADEGGGDADGLGEGIVVAGELQGEGGEGGAGDDGEEGEHDEEAVGARELVAVHQFGDDAVFGGAVEGALEADEEEDGVEEEVVLVLEGEDGGEHDDELEDFAGDEDGAFAVAVGHDAGGGGKDEEGQDEDGGGDGGDGRGGIRAVEADQEEHREELEDVVDEGTAELGDVEAEEIGREAGVVHVWHVEGPFLCRGQTPCRVDRRMKGGGVGVKKTVVGKRKGGWSSDCPYSARDGTTGA